MKKISIFAVSLLLIVIVTILILAMSGCSIIEKKDTAAADKTNEDEQSVMTVKPGDPEILEENISLNREMEGTEGTEEADEEPYTQFSETGPLLSDNADKENTPVPLTSDTETPGTSVTPSLSGEPLADNTTPQTSDTSFRAEELEDTLFVLDDATEGVVYRITENGKTSYQVNITSNGEAKQLSVADFAKLMKDTYGIEYSEAEYRNMIEQGTFAGTINVDAAR